jgi:hypothetical protein
LERGFAAFIGGVQSNSIDDSVLGFVRAIEGILHPNNKKQFCDRATKVIRCSTAADSGLTSLLDEIYDARSGFTHAEAIETVFPNKSRDEAVLRGRELRSASYVIASRCYRTVFANPDLIDFFSKEQGGSWGKVVTGKSNSPFTICVEPSDWLGPSRHLRDGRA